MSYQNILFQGDSITDCGRQRDPGEANIGLGSGYAMLSAAELLKRYPADKLTIFNRGISGNRVVDLYARWKIDCLNLKPDLLSILIGVNDTWHKFNHNNGVGLQRYERIYRELLTWTKESLPHIKLMLGEPFVLPFGAVNEEWLPEIAERRIIVKKLADEFDAAFIPYQTIFDQALQQAPAEYWLVDGVHPTLAGHSLMAAAWLEAFEKCGAQ